MPWRAVSSLPPEATSAALERDRPTVDLTRRHRSSDVLGLVLAFHISFALSARKTAQVLRQIFGVPLSYQSVLNYAQGAWGQSPPALPTSPSFITLHKTFDRTREPVSKANYGAAFAQKAGSE